MSGPAAVTCSGNNAVTPDVLLASACLPTMFQAIKIDGTPYWDGGYSVNPTITPLIRECKSQDTILVQINPVEREESPRSASEILNRLNEVSFNAVLLKELRMIALLRQVADPGNSEGAQWAGMRSATASADHRASGFRRGRHLVTDALTFHTAPSHIAASCHP